MESNSEYEKRVSDFYYKTTKYQMFLIIEQYSELLKDEESRQAWIERAEQEKQTLKDNHIF
jgi:hypothetical protein